MISYFDHKQYLAILMLPIVGLRMTCWLVVHICCTSLAMSNSQLCWLLDVVCKERVTKGQHQLAPWKELKTNWVFHHFDVWSLDMKSSTEELRWPNLLNREKVLLFDRLDSLTNSSAICIITSNWSLCRINRRLHTPPITHRPIFSKSMC